MTARKCAKDGYVSGRWSVCAATDSHALAPYSSETCKQPAPRPHVRSKCERRGSTIGATRLGSRAPRYATPRSLAPILAPIYEVPSVRLSA
eukprot:4625521-Pleurochrysis_carterae.AAC.3